MSSDCSDYVFTNLADESAFSDAIVALSQHLSQASIPESEQTFLVQEMIADATEFFLGAQRDGGADCYQPGRPGFGHMLLIGRGGIQTEVYQDHASILLPASREQLLAALHTTHVSRLLPGFRGRAPLAQAALENLMWQTQQLLLTHPDIVSLDFNPILVTTKRTVIVDAKIFVG